MLFTDQLNRKIELNAPPQRIISLVPSQTELLFDLGLDEAVVGITKFCVHPQEWFKSKAKIGGTKKLNIKKIISLKPDLIIANKEENLKNDIEILEKIAPVWISDINNLDTALEMIVSIGVITNKEGLANQISKQIKSEFDNLKKSLNCSESKTCIYLIWKHPYMTVGSDTFINVMLEYCNFKNLFNYKTRYPEIALQEIKDLSPELLLLSSEPYPFKQQHIDELQKYLPDTKILLVDGEMFSWYGSRLLMSVNYFKSEICV